LGLALREDKIEIALMILDPNGKIPVDVNIGGG